MRGQHCEGCGVAKRLQLHHLTYERLYDERPEDLLILCPLCHEKVERGKDEGAVPRRGKPEELRLLTLRLLKPQQADKKQRLPAAPKVSTAEEGNPGWPFCRNNHQSFLMGKPSFVDAVRRMNLKKFHKWCQRKFGKFDPKSHANAHALFMRASRHPAEFNRCAEILRELPPAPANPNVCVILDIRHIEQAMQKTGGVKRAQLEAIGVEWPPQRGWKRRVIGQLFTKEKIAAFLGH